MNTLFHDCVEHERRRICEHGKLVPMPKTQAQREREREQVEKQFWMWFGIVWSMGMILTIAALSAGGR